MIKKLLIAHLILGGLVGSLPSHAENPLSEIERICKRSKNNPVLNLFTDDIPLLTIWPNMIRVRFDCSTYQLYVVHSAVIAESRNGFVEILTAKAMGQKYLELNAAQSGKVFIKLKSLPMPFEHVKLGPLDFSLDVSYHVQLLGIHNRVIVDSETGVFRTKIQRKTLIKGRSVGSALAEGLIDKKNIQFTEIMEDYRPDFSGFGLQTALLPDAFTQVRSRSKHLKRLPLVTFYQQVSALSKNTPDQISFKRHIRKGDNPCEWPLL